MNQLLVCTRLSETGIVSPMSHSNTLRMPTAWLVQLHQIRGPVGRPLPRAGLFLSHFSAGKVLTEIAEKRLSAIRNLRNLIQDSRLPEGFRNSPARGLARERPVGHLMSVGYDMYLKLLEDAVLEEGRQTGKTRGLRRGPRGIRQYPGKICAVRRTADGFIPAYCQNPHRGGRR